MEGLKASFEETVERRHLAALKDGNDAVDKHRAVIKLDPNYRDAEMTIGLYDYTVGALPLPTKIAVGFLGHRGSKKRGIATIERVAREGNWVKEDAKTLLIMLYKRENRFTEAVALGRMRREMGVVVASASVEPAPLAGIATAAVSTSLSTFVRRRKSMSAGPAQLSLSC